MRAWTIMMFLILFTLSLNVIGALGVFNTPAGEAVLNSSSDIYSGITNFNFFSVITTTAGLVSLGAAVFLSLNMGAVVYSGVFSVVGVSLGSFIENIEQATSSTKFAVSTPMETLLGMMITFVFLWGFIKLAS